MGTTLSTVQRPWRRRADRSGNPPARPGFTLVELLVVMTILGILAGLISGAVIMARTRAKIAAIKMEISDLDRALENYKTEAGEYPPDFAGILDVASSPATTPAIAAEARKRVVNHLRKRFQKYRLPPGTDPAFQQFVDDIAWTGLNPFQFDAASGLAFWLGGFPDVNGKLAGVTTDVEDPFDRRQNLPLAQRPPRKPQKGAFFEFNPERFRMVEPITGRFMRYVPTGLNDAPYVYFRAYRQQSQQYEYGTLGVQSSIVTPFGISVPYRDANAPGFAWRDLNKYQIISTGLDEKFGVNDATVARLSRSGDGFSPEDMDNITSFAESRLEAELP